MFPISAECPMETGSVLAVSVFCASVITAGTMRLLG